MNIYTLNYDPIKYIPYTYLIGWSHLNKWYYGSETATGGNKIKKGRVANPNNLWSKYFTSSKIVKLFRKVHGEPDVIQVRKTFLDKKSALAWENKVLCRMCVTQNDNWLNQSIRCMDGSTSSKGWMRTPSGIELMREARKKFKDQNPEYHVWNKGLTKDNNDQLRKASERAKANQASGKIHCIGDSMRGRKFSDDHREKLKNAACNREKMVWVSNDTIEISTKIVQSLLEQYISSGWKRGRHYGYISPFKTPRPKITCPHCNKTGVDMNMRRYHFDNCKSNLPA